MALVKLYSDFSFLTPQEWTHFEVKVIWGQSVTIEQGPQRQTFTGSIYVEDNNKDLILLC